MLRLGHEPWHARRVLYFQRQQHVQITIDLMPGSIAFFDRRQRSKVREKVERPSPPPRKQTLRRARKKTEQVGFRKTVQVDHEIKLAVARVFDDLENSQHGERLESVAQRDAIDGDGGVSTA